MKNETPVPSCEIFKNTFFAEHHWTTTSDYSSSKSSEGGLANEAISYDIEIKVYQFEPKVQVIKKVSPGEKMRLTFVFEGVRNIER